MNLSSSELTICLDALRSRRCCFKDAGNPENSCLVMRLDLLIRRFETEVGMVEFK